jgi:hypothetical protein
MQFNGHFGARYRGRTALGRTRRMAPRVTVAEEKLRKRSSRRCQADISLDYATMGGDGRVVPAAAGPGPCHHQGSVGVIVKGLNVSGHDNSTDAEMRRRPGMRPLLELGSSRRVVSVAVGRGQ